MLKFKTFYRMVENIAKKGFITSYKWDWGSFLKGDMDFWGKLLSILGSLLHCLGSKILWIYIIVLSANWLL